jgi:hypothetical protein
MAQCKPLIQAIATATLRHEFGAYLESQLDTAQSLGLDVIGMPISTNPLESLYGLSKSHGVGETRDPNRIAMRLPALCGIPTREEAERALGVSVAEHQEITAGLASLTKQRRDVLLNPDRIESLIDGQTHVELIPNAKNRSNNQKILQFPVAYRETRGSQMSRQNGYG